MAIDKKELNGVQHIGNEHIGYFPLEEVCEEMAVEEGDLDEPAILFYKQLVDIDELLFA